MKQSNILILLSLLMSMVGAKAFAHDIEVANSDGVTIYYNWVNGNELSVSYRGTSIYSGVYSGNVVIPSSVVYNGNTYSVTSIGNWAFSCCKGLSSVTIPNSVTSICAWAFEKCFGLTSVTIPNSVTSIGYQAFFDCGRLTSVTIPNSVTSIGHEAFFGTAWYSNQPKGLVYAGKVAYEYKGEMPENTSIIIKDGTLGIADNAFYDCDGLTSVTIPNSVTSIGDQAFYGCDGLTSVTIPNSVTSIDREAFSYCSGLNSVTFGNSVTSIGYHAFYGTPWIWNLPDGLVYAGKVAFTYQGEMPENLIIKDGTLGIADCAFENCTGLTSITIPNSVTSIGSSAFSGSGLTSVTIPNSVTKIGGSAFSNCRRLTSVTIPNSVTYIGSVFNGCTALTSVTIPNSVTSIGYLAFDGCSGLTSVTIPNSVTFIDDGAFQNCSGLTSVTIPNSVIYIGSAFHSCSGLTSVTIGNSVTYIDNGAFQNCSGLTSVTIPNSVTSIGAHAFSGCSGLTSVTIGNSMMSIGEDAFRNCSGLTSVTIPNSVTSIGAHAFSGCSGLTSVTIGNSVTAIGHYAFEGCDGLTSVTIPNSVTYIGHYAFEGCDGLTSVTSLISTPIYLNENTFSNYNIPLYVPSKSVEAYKAAEPWSKFSSILAIDSTPSQDVGDTFKAQTKEGVWMTFQITSLEPKTCQVGDGEDASIDVVTVGKVTIPETANDFKVTAIGSYGFFDCSKLTAIYLSENIESIGIGAFASCSDLTSVTIPNSVTSIGDYAFEDCSNLASITSYITSPFEISDDSFDTQTYETTNLIVPHGTKSTYQKTNGWKNFKNIFETGSEPATVKTVDISEAGTLANYISESEKYTLTELTVTGYLNSTDFKLLRDMAGNNYLGEETAGKLLKLDLNGATIVKGGENYLEAKWVYYTSGYGISTSGNALAIENDNELGKDVFMGCKLQEVILPSSLTSIAESAFSYCLQLTNVTLPEGLLSIGESVFLECEALSTLTIPNSVTTLGRYAFAYCNSLTSMTIPDGITTLEDNLFYDCRGLSSVVFPASVTKLKNQVFELCSSLTEVTVYRSTPPSTGYQSFTTQANATLYVPKGCIEAYKAVELWNNFSKITEIQGIATNYSEYIWEAGVNNDWGTYAQPLYSANQDGIYSGFFYAQDSDWSGGMGAFKFTGAFNSWDEGNYGTGIINDDGLSGTLIDDGGSGNVLAKPGFYKATVNLAEMTYQLTPITGIGLIGPAQIGGWNNETELTYNPTTRAWEVTIELAADEFKFRANNSWDINWGGSLDNLIQDGSSLEIKKAGKYFIQFFPLCETKSYATITESGSSSEIGSVFEVDGIYFKVGENNTVSVTSGDVEYSGDVMIPSYVTYNGNTYSVTSIGDYAFANCRGLTSVTIGNNVTSIGSQAFRGCFGLTSVTIGNSVTSIGDYAFVGCDGLTSVTIPKSVTSIGHGVFAYCSNLATITVDAGNTVYNSPDGSNAIIKTTSNELVAGCKNTTIPNSVTSIGEHAFSFCSGLTSITIPNSVTSIGYMAFEGCNGLTSVTIPKSVTYIGSGVFADCSNLATITVDAGNTVYNSPDGSNAIIETTSNELVAGCKNTTIPNSVTSIGSSAFFGCRGLTSVTIGNSVTSIGSSAFYYCRGLTSVTIPNSVTSIGQGAFMYCSGLTSVTSLISNPISLNEYTFSNYNIPLYVPSESVEAYRAMKPWNEFKEIIPIYLTPIEKEVDYGGESSTVDENTDLGGTVIDNVYYNISSGNGGFDADEKCLVVNKAMSDDEVEDVFGKDLLSDEVKDNFTGIVIMVPAGKGKVAIDAQTTGGMTLMVKVGAADPIEMELEGKQKMKYPYDVTEPTYVYIYAGQNAAARTRAAEVPSLKIYGISLEMDILKGDANGDGVVNDADVKDVASHIMGMTPKGFNKDAADVNNDNKVNAADIVLINKFLNKK